MHSRHLLGLFVYVLKLRLRGTYTGQMDVKATFRRDVYQPVNRSIIGLPLDEFLHLSAAGAAQCWPV